MKKYYLILFFALITFLFFVFGNTTIDAASSPSAPLHPVTPTPSTGYSVYLPLVTKTIVLPARYIVQKDDQLYKIARLFEVNVYDIARANGIENINLIYTGQVLLIPAEPVAPPALVTKGKSIIVVLSTQRVYAYEDGIMVRRFIVSTGLPETLTPAGRYAIYAKSEKSQTMYFYERYSLHGTYAHLKFGTPMSSGDIELRMIEARWLYEWAPLNTPITIFPVFPLPPK